MVYYGREYKEENRRKKEPGERLKPQQWLLDLLWNSLRKMPRGTQVKRDGLVITVERRGISSGIALRHPWLQRRDCPLRCRPQGSDSQDNWDWKCLGILTQAPVPITPEEPQVLITVGGQSVDFFGHWGNFLCAHWSPWSAFLPIHYHNGTVWMSQTVLFQSSFKLKLGLCTVPSRVFDPARVSLTPSGEGYTEQGPCLCFHEYGACSF